MSGYVPYIVFGLITGSIYGISAMGLVLTYKTSGLFNFAHGAISASAAFAFYSLRDQHGLPWGIAAILTLFVFAPALALVLQYLGSRLAVVSTTYRIVATVGILVSILALAVLIFGSNTLQFDRFLPQETVFTVEGVNVNYDNLANVAIGVVAAVSLSVFFRVSRLGRDMRAVVDDPQLLDMTGTSPARVRTLAWLIGTVFAALSGIMFAAYQQQLDVNVLSLLVVQAFGAAAIGRFTSLPMAFVGGMVVGLLQNVMSKVVASHENLQGLDTNMPFIVLFILLLVLPRAQLVEVGRHIKNKAVPESRFTREQRAGGYGLILVVALLIPSVVGAHLPAWNTAMSQVVLFLSLSVLVRTSGQISLCHVGFAAIGAAGFGHMLGNGVPWGLAVLIGGLIVVPVGALLAIPAIRLSGLYLGLATLGFGILLTQYAYNKPYFFGGELVTSRPDVLNLDDNTRFYYVLLLIAVLCMIAVALVERSRLGRILRGLSDSPLALSTLGVHLSVARVMVFCFSAFLAGVSGATYASLFGSVTSESFNYVQSLVILAVLSISGRRTITAAIVAPILLYIPPSYISNPDVILGLQVAFGVAAVFVAITSQTRLSDLAARATSRSEERHVDPVRSSVRREIAALSRT